MGYIADHHDNLLSMLNDQQKELLKKFDDFYNKLTDIHKREIFMYAFKLGVKLIIPVVCEETIKYQYGLGTPCPDFLEKWVN